MDLRCENGIKFGSLGDGVIEMKCRSRRCGAVPGVVVLHRFSSVTGESLETQRFKDPKARKENYRATDHDAAALRAAGREGRSADGSG